MNIQLLLRPILAVAFAAVVRVGTDPATITRTVGQQIACDAKIMVSSVQTSSTIDVGYDPAYVTPRVPGGPVGAVTVTVPTPGTLRIAWAGATPPPDSTVIYSAVFDCARPGTTRLTIRAVSAVDATGAAISSNGLSEDTLVIKAKPVVWRLLLQP